MRPATGGELARFWESETAAVAEPESIPDGELGTEAEMKIPAKAHEGEETREQATAPPALTVSAGDFAALEERVLRAVALVKQERQARLAAEARAAEAEARLAQAEDRVGQAEARMAKAEARVGEQAPRIGQMEAELATLQTERDQVRQRVERLLEQLDAIEI